MYTDYKIRPAQREDVPFIIAMLANDPLGAKRENYSDPLPESYYTAFSAIENDPNHEPMVLEVEGEVCGTLQLSFLPYLTYQGGWRAQIEAVRIHEKLRGQGWGQKVFEWAISRARERGAHVLQLTTDKARPEALNFYEKLGFVASHEGMKMHFSS